MARHGLPNWTNEEWVIALDFYLKHRGAVPSKTSKEVKELSKKIRSLNLHEGKVPKDKKKLFRNPNGIYLQLMGFARLDEKYPGKGTKIGEAGVLLWDKYHKDKKEVAQMAQEIFGLDRETTGGETSLLPEGMEFALEGELLSHKHWVRERKSGIVERKKKLFLEKYKDIFCEVCDFNYRKNYGERGEGYIECHHIRPLSDGIQLTKLEDLILICASCHRMIHRKTPWLDVGELEGLVKGRPYP